MTTFENPNRAKYICDAEEQKMAAKIVFLMTMRGVFRPDLPLSFFSCLYRKQPRVLYL